MPSRSASGTIVRCNIRECPLAFDDRGGPPPRGWLRMDGGARTAYCPEHARPIETKLVEERFAGDGGDELRRILLVALSRPPETID